MAQRVFLDWSRPLVDGLTEWLTSGWTAGQGALDLSNMVVVVPTSGAGRRLRSALALWADARDTGVLSPEVITPEVLITWGVEAALAEGGGKAAARGAGQGLAGRGEQVLAWASVLAGLNLGDWRELFPVDPVNQDLSWALGAAADVLKLRRTLEEGGHDLSSAARVLATDENPETARWACLTRLEELAVRRLESGGWRDPVSARLAAAAHPALPGEDGPARRAISGSGGAGENDGSLSIKRRLVLAGVPDSIQLTRTALAALEAQALAEITVAVHAPEALADTFDEWGRPLPERWTVRDIRLPKGNDTITLTSKPEDAAGFLIGRLTAARGRGGLAEVVIGSADGEVSAPLRRMAASEGIDLFDPEGIPLLEHEVSWLVKTLTRLLHSGSWQAAGQFLRLPEVLAVAAGAEVPADHGHGLRLLADWDAFQIERLPRTLPQAAELVRDWAAAQYAERQKRGPEEDGREVFPSALPQAVGWLAELPAKFHRASVSAALTDLLEMLYSGKRFATPAERQRFLAALTAWQEAVTAVEQGAAVFLPALSTASRLDLAASLVRDTRLYTAHADEAHAVNGWLELPWQEAPDLVIAGMNEGMVPDSVLGDAWLPDSVRGALSLKTNDTRLARDSYLLTAMIESRRAAGSVRLLCGRLSSAGDPLKPSRLLLRCPAADLPSRALHLFPRELEDGHSGAPAAPWSRAWRLAVPPMRENAPVFQRLSVTAFSDYLECPFRFYLKHVLKMEPCDVLRGELDARMAGNLFHNTMEDFHKHTALRDSQDAGEIAAFLHAVFDGRAARMFGRAVTIPVSLQLEVLRNCLTKAAEIHAEESARGWRFREVEMQFPTLVRIDGTEIRGRIDLIQYHPEHGYRILDYKTSSKAKPPMEAHLQYVKSKAERERRLGLPGGEWTTVEHGGKFYLWKNLQLPLYARIMADHYGAAKVAVGYINLPRAVSESKLEVWENLDEGTLDAAWECAKGVIRSIRQGIFWPPAASVKYDGFKSLIFEDAASSFDPARLLRLRDLIETGGFHPGAARPPGLPESESV